MKKGLLVFGEPSTNEPNGGMKAVRNERRREEKQLTVWWAPCERETTTFAREKGKSKLNQRAFERERWWQCKILRVFLGSLQEGDIAKLRGIEREREQRPKKMFGPWVWN
uniref:Uncharacterized protein n=1 Tax=Cucumis melo TaxID=3656 RepID=A0A9I9E5M5_CUCME